MCCVRMYDTVHPLNPYKYTCFSLFFSKLFIDAVSHDGVHDFSFVFRTCARSHHGRINGEFTSAYACGTANNFFLSNLSLVDILVEKSNDDNAKSVEISKKKKMFTYRKFELKKKNIFSLSPRAVDYYA